MAITPPVETALIFSPDLDYYQTGVNTWLELSRSLPHHNNPAMFNPDYLEKLSTTASIVLEFSELHTESSGTLISPDLQTIFEYHIGQLYEINNWLENCGLDILVNFSDGYDQILVNLAAYHATPHTCRLIAQRCEYKYSQYRRREECSGSGGTYLPQIIYLLQDHFLSNSKVTTLANLPNLQEEITRRAQHLPVNQYHELYRELYYYLQWLENECQDKF